MAWLSHFWAVGNKVGNPSFQVWRSLTFFPDRTGAKGEGSKGRRVRCVAYLPRRGNPFLHRTLATWRLMFTWSYYVLKQRKLASYGYLQRSSCSSL